MGRAARRRQEKVGQLSGGNPVPPGINSLFSQAVAHHQARRFPQAEQLYQHILSLHPTHPEALHLLGLTAYQQADTLRAIELISQAISYDKTGKPLYHYNLGLVLEKEGRLHEAESAYVEALRLNPSYVEAQSNLGNVWRSQGRLKEAAQAFQTVLRMTPRSVEAHNNLGVIFKELGDSDRAIDEYRAALQLNPGHAEALNNLGVALKEQGKLEEAKTSFQQALSHKPHYANAQYHLGLVYLWQQQPEEALACFRQSADMTSNHRKPVALRSVTQARIKHDLDQIQFLLANHLLSDLPPSYLDGLQSLHERAVKDSGNSLSTSLTRQDQTRIGPSFNQILYYAKAEAVSGGALNPMLDIPAIEARYFQNTPEAMYVDDLLNVTALNSLRQFCLESTIWKRDYHNGYIGTFLANGFSCPLLLQIAEELRIRFPTIFQHHRLAQAWAFKQDSALRGLNMHADAAAVNVNFWITPDEANLDPTSGGLIVWDKEAPDEWDFKEYNSDKNTHKIREFLDKHHAKAITVPYRQNRAVIFNSNLFHETDRLAFKSDYESRRINVTLLYGSRQQSQGHKA